MNIYIYVCVIMCMYIYIYIRLELNMRIKTHQPNWFSRLFLPTSQVGYIPPKGACFGMEKNNEKLEIHGGLKFKTMKHLLFLFH